MKEFTNIDPRTVTKLTRQLFKFDEVVNASDNDDAIITATEYIGEVFRNQYDHEDVEFVLDHLYMNPTTGTVYVLEMQGNPEQEELVFESIYNPYWNNNTWEVVLETEVSLYEADRLVNYADQGWYNAGNCEYHSLMIILRKFITVETSNIKLYVDAVNNIGGDIKVVDYYPAKH
jgi:hypothetical protein